MSEAVTHKLVVIGLAGVDWHTLEAKLAAGGLPGLARLMAQGTAGPLLSSPPAAEIATWGTIATGLWPEEHGLIVPEEPWPGGLRPAGKASWRTDPAWQRLAQSGIASASVNWPATAPGRSWTGVHVDDRFPLSNGWGWADWPLPVGVAPDEWRDELRDLRVHVSNISGSMLAGAVPDYKTIDQSRDHRLLEVARQLAAFATIHAAVQAVLQAEWRVLFVRYDILARARDALTGVPSPYDHVVDSTWTIIDAAVTDLAARAGPETTVMLASPGYQGRAGAFVITGPDISAGRRAGATTLDIAPTVYARFGRGDPRLPGRLLAGSPGPLLPLPEARTPAVAARPNLGDLARVEAAGLKPPAPAPEHRVRQLLAEAQLLAPRDPQRAGALALEAEALAPATAISLGLRAVAHIAAGEIEPLPAIADRIDAIAPRHLWADLVRAGHHGLCGQRDAARPLLLRVEREGGPDERMRAAAIYLMLGEERAARRLFRNVAKQLPDSIGALLGLASTSGSAPEIEKILRRVLQLDPSHTGARTALAKLVVSSALGQVNP